MFALCANKTLSRVCNIIILSLGRVKTANQAQLLGRKY